VRRRSRNDILIDLFVYTFLLVVGFLTLYPFWNITVLAFNDALDSLRGGITFWPRMWTLDNFRSVLRADALITAAINSVLRTVIGVVAGIIVTTMLAYTLSRREYVFRKIIQRLFVLTMYVHGGLIPLYFVIRGLGLRNNFLVYILPLLINAFYLIIVRSYMDTIPESLHEAARIDGANDFFIYRTIVFPLSLPVIATIALFISVYQWNSWFDTFIFVSEKRLTTLQFELMRIISQSTIRVQNIEEIRDKVQSQRVTSTPESIRMAITVVVTAPILFVYPFIQRYFIKGMTIGAIKG
jgi:putative aldouronate transport system permease protein